MHGREARYEARRWDAIVVGKWFVDAARLGKGVDGWFTAAHTFAMRLVCCRDIVS